MKVCVFGRCKCKVDGNADAIAIGDMLVTHNADGVAQLANLDAYGEIGAVFAMALKASTADGDIIPVFVGLHLGTHT